MKCVKTINIWLDTISKTIHFSETLFQQGSLIFHAKCVYISLQLFPHCNIFFTFTYSPLHFFYEKCSFTLLTQENIKLKQKNLLNWDSFHCKLNIQAEAMSMELFAQQMARGRNDGACWQCIDSKPVHHYRGADRVGNRLPSMYRSLLMSQHRSLHVTSILLHICHKLTVSLLWGRIVQSI